MLVLVVPLTVVTSVLAHRWTAPDEAERDPAAAFDEHIDQLQARAKNQSAEENSAWTAPKARLDGAESPADTEPVAAPAASAATASPAALPAPPEWEEPEGARYVQVASLRSVEQAEQLAEQLRSKGHHARCKPVRDAGDLWQSVRIGPFATQAEAEIYRHQFDQQGGGSSLVVPRSHGPYHVQVASLCSEASADGLTGRLQARRYRARRRNIRSPNKGVWSTVRIGPFDTRSDAEGFRAYFEKREGLRSVVIPYDAHRPANPVRRSGGAKHGPRG